MGNCCWYQELLGAIIVLGNAKRDLCGRYLCIYNPSMPDATLTNLLHIHRYANTPADVMHLSCISSMSTYLQQQIARFQKRHKVLIRCKVTSCFHLALASAYADMVHFATATIDLRSLVFLNYLVSIVSQKPIETWNEGPQSD